MGWQGSRVRISPYRPFKSFHNSILFNKNCFPFVLPNLIIKNIAHLSHRLIY
eukprot:UN18797